MTSLIPQNSLNLFHYNEQINPILLKICSEFLEFLNLNYFAYGFYNDGAHFTVRTNLDLCKHTLERNLFSIDSQVSQERIRQVPPYQIKAFINSGEPQDSLHQCVFDFNIWNSQCVMLRKEDSLHWWSFGTDRENYSILSDYINKRGLFESFIKYFNAAAADLISIDENLMITHPGYKIPAYDPSNDNASQHLQTKFLKDLSTPKNAKMYLTKREIECINYLGQGKAAKEIASLLKISPRTVEYYLQNARMRLKCSDRRHLIKFFRNNYC
ncbi:MAG: helix-turn-helix transcriptional regulator [Alphaproteobacteria bacterium]|nr:helix-turn-helix transcriptional regulator [Alphaproteobacteria bacterium]